MPPMLHSRRILLQRISRHGEIPDVRKLLVVSYLKKNVAEPVVACGAKRAVVVLEADPLVVLE